MEYVVTRNGTTLVTVHEDTGTTARKLARSEIDATLGALADDDDIAAWTIDTVDVYEPPTAPFEPYTVSVSFSVTVSVSASDASAAEREGAAVIDDVLAGANVDGISYTSAPASTAV